MEHILEQARGAIRRGDDAAAQRLLYRAIKANPRSEDAWLCLSTAVEDTAKKRECLQRVLALNPANQVALSGLARLDASESSVLQTIDYLNGYDFEVVVARLLERMGLQVHLTSRASDGGVDIVAKSEDPITGGSFVVQCKRYSSPVGVTKVRELYGVVNHLRATKGILITNSEFTKQAQEFALGKPIQLIDGNELRALLLRHGYGTGPLGDREITLLPESYRAFCQGLRKISEEITTALEPYDMAGYRGQECDVPQLMEVLRSLEFYRVAAPDIARVINRFGRQNSASVTRGDTERQLQIIRDTMNRMLKLRQAVIDMRVVDRCVPVKEAAVEVFTVPLADMASWLANVAHQIGQLDGRPAGEDLGEMEFIFTFDFGEAGDRLNQELERLAQSMSEENAQRARQQDRPRHRSLWERLFG